jgi:diguanylate cyclase (GGDEF)-like protein
LLEVAALLNTSSAFSANSSVMHRDNTRRDVSQQLKEAANEHGVAVAVVDAAQREVFVANPNSICECLNPKGGFSPACAEYCGKAMKMADENGGTAVYECHAGLQCRASNFEAGGNRYVAIVGRSFTRAEKYREAATRAMAGDWSRFAPTSFFRNLLLSSSSSPIEKAEARVRSVVGSLAESSPVTSEAVVRDAPAVADDADLTAEGPAAPSQQPPDLTSEWRSFFGSMLKVDYRTAAERILEFVHQRFELSSLVWLERKDDSLDTLLGWGAMKDRKLRLSLPADDERLVHALAENKPLQLGERVKNATRDSRTMSLFPIGVSGEVSAAIAVLDRDLDDAVAAHLIKICRSVAPQLEILRLRREVSRSFSLASAVRSFSESLRRADTEDLWAHLTQNAAEMLKAERASLLVYDAEKNSLRVKALIGAKNRPAPDEPVGRRVARAVLRHTGPIAVDDITRTSLPPPPADRSYKTPSFLSCPININGKNIGVMSFTDRTTGQRFDETAIDLFQAISPQLAVAIDRALLKERAGEFEQLSVTDPLTGLLNRRYIEERMQEEIRRSTRHGLAMSFIMLDVDNFKSYNDSFGHPAGDEALKKVAHVLRDTLRSADVAARYGGEEFSILLPQTTGEEAFAIAERIRRNIEQTNFAHRRVTASIGIASCSAELCISANLVLAADRALYKAKELGRNRVVVFEQLVSESKVAR